MNDTPPNVLTAPTPEPLAADPAARTLTGLIVPFGPAGYTKAGLMTFASGALKLPTDPTRVKLLLEHDQNRAVGYATSLEERPEGIWAVFSVPEGEAGDRALSDAGNRLRDSFSVGTQLDDVTAEKLRQNAVVGASTAATGTLREVSLVSVPAFPESQVQVAAATGDLAVMSWHTPSVPPQPRGETPVTVTTPEAITTPEMPTPAPAPGPVPVLANAGAALITTEAATYRFDGSGPSMIADAAAAQKGDSAAAGRLERFNAELLNRNTATELAVAAVLLRDPVPDSMVPNQATRPPIETAVAIRRPLVDRVTPIPIKNAQPFYVPTIGAFTGIGVHTEGTAHVTEGTLTLGDGVVTPTAISGAFRMSRELAESSSPALDVIALRAMVKEYAKTGEGRVAAALEAGKGSTSTSVDTVAELRSIIIDILGATDEMPEGAVLSAGLYKTLAADVDTSNRPFLSNAPAVNSAIDGKVGVTGTNIDGVPIDLAAAIIADAGYIFSQDSTIYAETPAQQFRLDQPEGPGIIKLALFGYSAAKVIQSAKVKKLTKA